MTCLVASTDSPGTGKKSVTPADFTEERCNVHGGGVCSLKSLTQFLALEIYAAIVAVPELPS